MNEFYVLLPTDKLPTTQELQKRLSELEPGFSLDTQFNPAEGGVWECTYQDEEGEESYCCDFSIEPSAPLFEEAPELVELSNNCQAVAVFISEEEDDFAASYAIAEALLSLVPEGFLFDPFEGALMHGEDAVVFFNDQLTIVDEDSLED